MTKEQIQLTKNILRNFTDAYSFLFDGCDGSFYEEPVFNIDKKFLNFSFTGDLEEEEFIKLKKKLKEKFDKVKLKITQKVKDGEFLWFYFSLTVSVSLENLWGIPSD